MKIKRNYKTDDVVVATLINTNKVKKSKCNSPVMLVITDEVGNPYNGYDWILSIPVFINIVGGNGTKRPYHVSFDYAWATIKIEIAPDKVDTLILDCVLPQILVKNGHLCALSDLYCVGAIVFSSRPVMDDSADVSVKNTFHLQNVKIRYRGLLKRRAIIKGWVVRSHRDSGKNEFAPSSPILQV